MEPKEPDAGHDIPRERLGGPDQPPKPKRGLVARLKQAMGRFVGSSGPRAGQRDPDPGDN